MLGVSADNKLTFAADTLQCFADGTSQRDVQKILPLEKGGACAYTGRTDFRQPPVDLLGHVREYIESHRALNCCEAALELTNVLAAGLRKVGSRFSGRFGCAPGDLISQFAVLGYYDYVPWIFWSEFRAPQESTRIPQIETHSFQVRPGFIKTLGADAVAREILSGDSEHFDIFKRHHSVQKYRKEDNAQLTTDELFDLSLVCLQATESAEGRQFHPSSKLVGGPNKFGMIESHEDSLVWKNEPPA